tara:strand:+ start:61 stop:237 length:177 start_codon:yes stop_codon:yes gene_type:complete
MLSSKVAWCCEDLSLIMAATAKCGEDGILAAAFEGASGQVVVCLHVCDPKLGGAAPAQ